MKGGADWTIKGHELTSHASRRMAQRAISETVVQLIEVFGESHYQKGGTEVLQIRKEVLAQLRAAVEHAGEVSVVKGEQNRVITVMHRYRRVKSTRAIA